MKEVDGNESDISIEKPTYIKKSDKETTFLINFFISYNSSDLVWAEWIAWQLEEAGYSTVIQAWDFRPGSNFILEMQQAAAEAQRTIIVLSSNYLNALFTQPEWAAAFQQDPTGERRILVPIRVQECKPEGLLSQIVYIDLVGLNESVSRERLLADIRKGRGKPIFPPAFPESAKHSAGMKPFFPSELTPIPNKALKPSVRKKSNPDSEQKKSKNRAIRVLLVYANPRNTSWLRLGAENRVIREAIQLSLQRSNITLKECHAATIHDIRRSLLNEQFQIVHISGHGTGRGLILEDDLGGVHVVPQQALAKLFHEFRSTLKCVILNACYSISQGQLFSLGIPYTIAMEGPLDDKAAIEFSRGFYDAVGAGKSFPFAYQHGCITVESVVPSAQFISKILKKGETYAASEATRSDIESPYADEQLHFKEVKALVGLAIDLSGSMNESIRNNTGGQISRLEGFRQSLDKLVKTAQRSIQENRNNHVQTSIEMFAFGFGLRTKFADVCDLLSLIKIGKEVITDKEIKKLERQYSQDLRDRYRGYDGTDELLRQRGLGSLMDVIQSAIIRPTAESQVRDRIKLEVKARIEKLLQTTNDSTLTIEEIVDLWGSSGDVLSSSEELIFGNTPMKKALVKVAERFERELKTRDKDTISILFILSDGEPMDGDPLPIVQMLKSRGITVISCFVTDKDVANPRILFNNPEPHWSKGAKLMFEMASTMEDSEIAKFLLHKGWVIQSNARLFVQLNHSDILEEFIRVILGSLESTNATQSLPRGI